MFVPYVSFLSQFSALVSMPSSGVPTGPRHLSGQALFPAPFVPPAVLAEVWPGLKFQHKICMACNLPEHEMQVELFEKTAKIMVRSIPRLPLSLVLNIPFYQMSISTHRELISVTQYLYDMYFNAANKFRQYIDKHPGKYPGVIISVLDFCDELTKLRERAKRASVAQVGRNRDERISALEDVQASKSRSVRPPFL